MQLTTENYEYFAGCEELVNEILAAHREEAVRQAESEDAAIKKIAST